MASTSFLARSPGDRDVSCHADVVSDKADLLQWAWPYSPNIERWSGRHRRSVLYSHHYLSEACMAELETYDSTSTGKKLQVA
jgi:hypothetical protein